MTIKEYINCIKQAVRDYLVEGLEQGFVPLADAQRLARFTQDSFVETLGTHEEIFSLLPKVQQEFPQYYTKLKSIILTCELSYARGIIDQEINPLISEGKLDVALDKIKQFNLA